MTNTKTINQKKFSYLNMYIQNPGCTTITAIGVKLIQRFPNWTYFLVKWTPPFKPLEKVPLPLPPAKIWALSTNSLASVIIHGKKYIFQNAKLYKWCILQTRFNSFIYLKSEIKLLQKSYRRSCTTNPAPRYNKDDLLLKRLLFP